MPITYSGICNYRLIVDSRARAIEEETVVKRGLIHSPDIGVFEVRHYEGLIFSKIEAVCFPDVAKIVDAVNGKPGSSE